MPWLMKQLKLRSSAGADGAAPTRTPGAAAAESGSRWKPSSCFSSTCVISSQLRISPSGGQFSGWIHKFHICFTPPHFPLTPHSPPTARPLLLASGPMARLYALSTLVRFLLHLHRSFLWALHGGGLILWGTVWACCCI